MASRGHSLVLWWWDEWETVGARPVNKTTRENAKVRQSVKNRMDAIIAAWKIDDDTFKLVWKYAVWYNPLYKTNLADYCDLNVLTSCIMLYKKWVRENVETIARYARSEDPERMRQAAARLLQERRPEAMSDVTEEETRLEKARLDSMRKRK